mgnify:CR=1 FL=1
MRQILLLLLFSLYALPTYAATRYYNETCDPKNRCATRLQCTSNIKQGKCLYTCNAAQCIVGKPCDQCPGAETCIPKVGVGSLCICEKDSHCPSGSKCDDGQCSGPRKIGESCDLQKTCGLGLFCTSTVKNGPQACWPLCNRSRCLSGEPCKKISLLYSVCYCGQNSDCPGNAVCSKGRCQGLGKIGAKCSSNLPCQSGLTCAWTNVSQKTGYCVPICSDKTCPGGESCTKLPNGKNGCFCSSSRPCPDQRACVNGLCAQERPRCTRSIRCESKDTCYYKDAKKTEGLCTQRCINSDRCPVGTPCRSLPNISTRTCHCQTTKDCPKGSTCQQGRCAGSIRWGGLCDEKKPCAWGLVCTSPDARTAKRCWPPCQNGTCRGGEKCQSFSGASICFCTKDSECGKGGKCSSGRCRYPGTIGERCTPSFPCQGGLVCIWLNSQKNIGRCVSKCTTDNKCTGNERCLTNGGKGCICGLNNPCPSHQICHKGRCIEKSGPWKLCNANITCPGGFGCITGANSTRQGLCMRTCADKSQCTSSEFPCSTVPGTSKSVCGCFKDGDCGSSGWKCVNFRCKKACTKDCPEGTFCKDGVCRRPILLNCNDTTACEKGSYCLRTGFNGEKGYCVKLCQKSSQCGYSTPCKLTPNRAGACFCESDQDCPSGRNCFANQCYRTCAKTSDCAKGHACHLKHCVPFEIKGAIGPQPGEGVKEQPQQEPGPQPEVVIPDQPSQNNCNPPCTAGNICKNNTCQKITRGDPCKQASDCPSGTVCRRALTSQLCLPPIKETPDTGPSQPTGCCSTTQGEPDWPTILLLFGICFLLINRRTSSQNTPFQ